MSRSVWAGIVRVSFVGVRGGDSFHADKDQVADIERAIAGMPGAELALMPPELNVSGGLPLEKRPSLMAAIEGVERGEYAGIIVSYLSRLGRNHREQIRAWDRVEAAGGRIICVREQIDTSTPSGRLQRLILLGLAEHEREMHAERFDERRRLATEGGIWQRRQTPLGYSRDPATRRLVVNDDAPRVRRAFRDRAAGVSVSSIAETLGMTTSGARQLLANRVYLGELKVGRYVNPEAHDPIVGVAEWEAAQGGTTRPGRGGDRAPALLAGVVRCQGCGHVMSRTATARIVYACHRRSSAGRCPQPAAVTADLLDAHVERIVVAELARLTITESEAVDGVDDARTLLGDAERELAAYLAAVSAADVGAEAFAAGARLRRAAVDEAQAGLRRVVALKPAGPGFRAGSDAWTMLDVGQRNVLLRALLEVVTVRRGGGRGSRTPLTERVQVVRYGAGLPLPKRGGGVASGICPVPWLDVDDERVLRVPGGEDRL